MVWDDGVGQNYWAVFHVEWVCISHVYQFVSYKVAETWLCWYVYMNWLAVIP